MSDLVDLMACDRQQLIMRWRRAFGSTPPKHCSMSFLVKVLAHDLQCKAHGDVPRRIEKQLKAVLQAAASDVARSGTSSLGPQANPNAGCEVGVQEVQPSQRTVASLPPALSPGVQLVREWNGRTWHVEVLEDGFTCKGKTYRSLSAIARMITGTRWSGPRFFGLTPS